VAAAAAAAARGGEEGAVAVVSKVLRWVCSACHGVYFAPVNGACPGCHGQGKERPVEIDAAGVAHVPAD
jgi:hypothetical protein